MYFTSLSLNIIISSLLSYAVSVFTRGQFWPPGIVVAGVCPSVRQSVRPSVTKFVGAITHHPFKLESPSFEHRCKLSKLRSLLFFRFIDLELQGPILFQSQNLPHFEFVRAISHHWLKSWFTNYDQRCVLALSMSLLILGLIDIDLQLSISNQLFFFQTLRLSFICVVLYIFSEGIASECSTSHMAPHKYWFHWMRKGSRHGPWHSLPLYLGETIGVSPSFDSAIDTRFLPEASFGLRVLSLPRSVYLSV